jgi:release factor glutamine methyltransferase
LQEAWFLGTKFFVDAQVLIPRPETEELVTWLIRDLSRKEQESISYKILDVGTGSGCIPISIKKKFSAAEVISIDISSSALHIAERNATILKTEIRFIECDFLNKEERSSLPVVDIIISNPPYIPLAEKSNMDANVVRYEPGVALFVPNEDPLQFYDAIADFSKSNLNNGGSIYIETHEDLAKPVAEIFSNKGLKQIEIKNDLQGKQRMMRVVK